MSEMVAIPNTPTLVAEQNVEHQRIAGKERRNENNHAPRVLQNSTRSNKMKHIEDRLPQQGDYAQNDKGDRYLLKQKLGDGAMGHVFLTTVGNEFVAIKIEKFTTGMLPMEIRVLTNSAKNRKRHFCRIYDYGSFRKDYNFMVISLLSKDLYRLRAEMSSRSFSLNTTTKIALETLEAIEELHAIGYLSRDVKPSNFAPGLRENGDHKTIFMFDFGLAKRYIDRDNRKLKSRGEVGWRGTVRYGSLHAHKRLDLGRRDDMECWFYMLVEMYSSELPWRVLTERNAVAIAKLHIRGDGRENFFQSMPDQFETIMNMIDGYSFDTRPEYKLIRKLIEEIRVEHKLSDRTSWDWQTEESQYSELTETVSVISDPAIMAEKGATNYTDRNQG